MARIISVDFTGVESGSKFVRVPEGDYALKLKSIKGKVGGDSGKKYLAAVFDITGPSKAGRSIGHSFSLQTQSLWNLRNFLEACGKPTPAKAIKIDLDKMVGLECAGTLVDDTPYEGKIKSIISAFFPLSDLGETSEAGEEVEEAAEEEEAEEAFEEEAGEEEAAAAEEEEEEKPKPAAKKGKPKPAAKKGKPKAEESEEDDLFS